MTPAELAAGWCRSMTDYHNRGDRFKARAYADVLAGRDPWVLGVLARCRQDDVRRWRQQAMTVLREIEKEVPTRATA